MNKTPRIFFDIDGTLSKWTPVETFEQLLEPGFFANMSPNETVVQALKILLGKSCNEVELFSLSAYIVENPLALQEKNCWLDAHIPSLDNTHRLYCPCGSDKRLAVPGGIRPTDVLLDDYTLNLRQWSMSGKGMKLLNGINGTKGTWKGASVSMFSPPEEIAEKVFSFASSPELAL